MLATLSGLLLSSGSAHAQEIVTTARNYTELSASDPGCTELSLPTSHDTHVVALNIGFTYSFFGTDYTQVGIDSNGVIWMGGRSSGVTSNVALSSTGSSYADYDNYIAVLWDDLVADSPYIVQRSGTAPNRKITIQYSGHRYTYPDPPLDSIQFQVDLFESGTPKANVRYGAIGSGTTMNATVGVRGPTTSDVVYFPIPDGSGDYTCGPQCSAGDLGPLQDHEVIWGLPPDVQDYKLVVPALPAGRPLGNATTIDAFVVNRVATTTVATVTPFAYFSANNSLETSGANADTDILGSAAAPITIGIGVDADHETPLSIPIDTTGLTGNGYLFVGFTLAGGEDAIPSNNVASGSFYNQPDFLPTAVSGPMTGDNPTPLAPGSTPGFTATIENQGAAYASPVEFRIYASANQLLEPAADILLYTGTVPGDGWTNGAYQAAGELSVPADIAPGRYYLILNVDTAAPGIPEVREPNNIFTNPTQVLIGPELTAETLAFASSTPTTGAVDVTLTISRDRGSAYTAAVPVALYWSTDQTLQAAQDTQVTGAFEVAANATDAVFSVPPPTAPGYYYLIASIDPASAVTEVDETNNTTVTAGTLLNAKDLVSGNLSLSDARITMGDSITVTAELINVGIEYTGTVPVWVYFSEDATWSAGDIPMAKGYAFFNDRNPITFNQTFAVNQLEEGRQAVAPASYHVFVVIDPEGTVPGEANTQNNATAVPKRLETRGANISVSALNGPADAFFGRAYTFTFELQNTESVPITRPFSVSLRRSDNNVIRLGDPAMRTAEDTESSTLIDVEAAPGEDVVFAANQTRRFQASVWVPASTSTVVEDVFLGLIADIEGHIAETNEADNIRVLFPAGGSSIAPVHFRQPTANLQIALGEVPSQVGGGESLLVSRTVKNDGKADAERVAYTYYLSTDETIGVTDTPVATLTLPSVPWDVPEAPKFDEILMPTNLPAGRYYLGAVIDPQNTQAETDDADNISNAVALELLPAVVRFVHSELPNAVLQTPYQAGLYASGGNNAVSSWSIVEGSDALPAGISLDPATGILSGTPTQVQVANFTVRADTPTGHAQQAFVLRVDNPTVKLQVATSALSPPVLGKAYERTLVAVGGHPPLRWSVVTGLPSGFTLTEEGVLSGTASKPFTKALQVRVTDAEGQTADAVLALNVVRTDGGLEIDTPLVPRAIVGNMVAINLTASNATGVVEWGAEGDLPEGMEIDAQTGRLFGRPPKVGTFVAVVRAQDEAGSTDSLLLVIKVESDSRLNIQTPDDLVAAKAGEAYDASFKATGGTEPYVWTLVSKASRLPKGFTVSSGGTMTGTPDRGGYYGFVLQVTDADGRVDTAPFTLRVEGDGEATAKAATTEGCACATTPTQGRPWLSLSVLALVGLALIGRRRRLGVAALVAVLGWTTGAAEAQPIPNTPYVGIQQSIQYTPTPVTATGPHACLAWGSSRDSQQEVVSDLNFTFYDTTHTQVVFQLDGYLHFSGSTSTDFSNDALGDAKTPNRIIAPFWEDMYAYATDACMQTWVEGVAPSRVWVFEWSNINRYRSHDPAISMRVKLHEGLAGRIDVEYGSFVLPSPMPSAWGGTMGMEEASSETATNADPVPFPVSSTCSPNCTPADIPQNTRITVLMGAQDLVASGIRAPTEANSGEVLDITAAVASVHSLPISGIDAQLSFVAATEDGEPPAPDAPPLTSTSTQVDLQGYGTLNWSTQLPAPFVGTTEAQAFYLRLSLPADALPGDVDTENNVNFFGPITVSPVPAADAVIYGIHGPQKNVTLDAGAAIDATTVQLISAGLGDLDTDLWVVLSKNQGLSRNDVALGKVQISLARGVVTDQVFDSLQVPASTGSGTYYLGAIVDPENKLTEFSKTNNVTKELIPVVVNGSGLAIVTQALPHAVLSTPYSAQLISAGPTGTWSVTDGQLPTGLQLMQSGAIQGTPTAEGAASFTVQVTDGVSTATQDLSLTVVSADTALTVVTDKLPSGTVGESYEIQLFAAGGELGQAQTWSATGLPKGLSVTAGDEDKGPRIAGAPLEGGTFDVTLEVSAGSQTATRELQLVIAEYPLLRIEQERLPQGTVGETYTAKLVVEGGEAPFIWTEGKGDTLKDLGLKLNLDGSITGTPTKVGTFPVAVEVRDSATPPAKNASTVFIEVVAGDGFKVVTQRLPTAYMDYRYDESIRATGGVPPYDWSLHSDSQRLPGGMDISPDNDSNEFRIRGLADEAGSYLIYVSVKDQTGQVATRVIPLVVSAGKPPNALTEALKEAGCTCTQSAPALPSLLALVGLFGLLGLRRRD